MVPSPVNMFGINTLINHGINSTLPLIPVVQSPQTIYQSKRVSTGFYLISSYVPLDRLGIYIDS